MAKEADILEFEGSVKAIMDQMEKGERITILKNGVPMATVQPLGESKPASENYRVPGTERDKLKILGDITGPCIPVDDWNMFKE